MTTFISEDMVLSLTPPLPVLCLDVCMIRDVEIDVFWQRCTD